VDADDRYLNVRYGLQWTDLKDLSKPLRVGVVVILPGKSLSLAVEHERARADWQ